jgi:hypothetical protein
MNTTGQGGALGVPVAQKASGLRFDTQNDALD